MRNPLHRRFPRELRANAGKYAGIFVMLVMAIGLTSGFLNAASSIQKIIDGMDETYAIEDGRFTCDFEPSKAALTAAADAPADSVTGAATIHPLESYDVPLTFGDGTTEATARVYEERTDIDRAAYAEGAPPATPGEIALDRVFCAHNDLAVGDTVTLDGRVLTLSGIMTLPDYSALFEKNTDFVFNSLTFTVAEMTPDGFAQISESGKEATYTYAFTFANDDASIAERVSAERTMASTLAAHGAQVTDLIDASANQGIGYPADDVEGDTTMWIVLMLILIVIMSFVFVVLVASTIEAESAVIGTLLASGWRKRELMAHYLTLPCAVGVIAAIVGNVLGNVALSDTMRGLYYNSYSLPPYVATWDWGVFALTTVAPLALLIGITCAGLALKMRCTPLQFLRHDTARGGRRRGIALPARLGFVTRFRLRVFLTNLGNFVTLFFGIGFASLLLLFGLCVMPTMTHYADSLANDVSAKHLYLLKAPLEIDGTPAQQAAWQAAEQLSKAESLNDISATPADALETLLRASAIGTNDTPVNTRANDPAAIAQAEKFAMTTLEFERPGDAGEESISVYGIEPDSRYWTGLDLSGGGAKASAGFLDKFGLNDQETITLDDKYEDRTYDLALTGTYGSDSTMAVYLSLDDFNQLLGNDADYFNGYASNEDLAIQELYLASDLTPESMDKIGAQMTASMGSMMSMLLIVAVVVFVVFMYLLTKTVIDRSARAISYLKVFGYRDREISRLYVRSITCTVAVSLVACLAPIVGVLILIFKVMMMKYSGNIVVEVPPSALIESVAAGLACYAVVAFLHMRRIKAVPLEIALKVQD